MKSMFNIFACAFLFVASSVQIANAQVEKHLGPLAEVVTLGVDGQWEAKLQDGWFNLFNTGDPGAVKFYYVTLPQLTAGERVVELNTLLRASGSEPASAGIFLDRNADNEYIAFTIAADGSVNVVVRTPDGFEVNKAENLKARLDGSDVLTMRETPTTASLMLNGEEAFTVDNSGGLSPTYGIIAVGAGRFAFSGLSITDKPADTPFPQPGGQTGDGGAEQPFPAPVAGGDDGSAPLPTPNPPTPQPTPQPTPTGGSLDDASPQDLYVGQVLLGTTFGVFFHEFGHALIGETKLPATGPEEDTADGFSAFVLGSMVEEGEYDSKAEQDFFEKSAEYASLYWYYSGLSMEQSGQQAPWQGEHAPDIKRFRNSFCILYGSSPERYEDIANKVKLEPRTKERCKAEFEKRYNAWEAILKTVTRNLGPDSPGDYPADAPGGKIVLTFQPSQTDVGQVVYRMLGETNAMAEILKEMEKLFVFPRDLQVEFRDCQEINAWYDPQAGKVTMCYSLIDAASKLIFQSEGAAQPGGGGQTGGGGQAPDPAAFLVGSWQASFQGDGGMVTMNVTYTRDGRYQSSAQTPYGPIQIAGTWQAQMAGQNMIMISINPTQWSPQQICDRNGRCQPNQQYPEQAQVQVLGQNSVTAQGVTWQRMQ